MRTHWGDFALRDFCVLYDLSSLIWFIGFPGTKMKIMSTQTFAQRDFV